MTKKFRNGKTRICDFPYKIYKNVSKYSPEKLCALNIKKCTIKYLEIYKMYKNNTDRTWVFSENSICTTNHLRQFSILFGHTNT